MPPEGWHIAIEVSVRPSVCLSVLLKTSVTLALRFAILKIATWYLACMCISWSCTFWVVKGQGHYPSRSKVKINIQSGAVGGIVFLTNTSLVYWRFQTLHWIIQCWLCLNITEFAWLQKHNCLCHNFKKIRSVYTFLAESAPFLVRQIKMFCLNNVLNYF